MSLLKCNFWFGGKKKILIMRGRVLVLYIWYYIQSQEILSTELMNTHLSHTKQK